MNVCEHCGDLLPLTPHHSSRYWIFHAGKTYPRHQTPPHECLGWDIDGNVVHHTCRMLNEIELVGFVYWCTQGWQSEYRLTAHLPADKLNPLHLRIIRSELDRREVEYEIVDSGWPSEPDRYKWSEMIGLGAP